MINTRINFFQSLTIDRKMTAGGIDPSHLFHCINHRSGHWYWKERLYLFNVFWIFMQEQFESFKTMNKSFGIIQSVHAEDDFFMYLADYPRSLFCHFHKAKRSKKRGKKKRNASFTNVYDRWEPTYRRECRWVRAWRKFSCLGVQPADSCDPSYIRVDGGSSRGNSNNSLRCESQPYRNLMESCPKLD